MIANLLRTNTFEKHKKLESLMFIDEIMNHSLSINDYKKLLAINYMVHAELEDKLFKMLNDDIAKPLNLASRHKLPALQKDLEFWNMNIADLGNTDIELYEPEHTQAETLGALYVLEGATLGGNVILKHILANKNFNGKNDGLKYYGVYGNELGSKWKTFVDVLNNEIAEIDYERCINGAHSMFDNMINAAKKLSRPLL